MACRVPNSPSPLTPQASPALRPSTPRRVWPATYGQVSDVPRATGRETTGHTLHRPVTGEESVPDCQHARACVASATFDQLQQLLRTLIYRVEKHDYVRIALSLHNLLHRGRSEERRVGNMFTSRRGLYCRI